MNDTFFLEMYKSYKCIIGHAEKSNKDTNFVLLNKYFPSLLDISTSI